MSEEKRKNDSSGTPDSGRTTAYILIGLGVLFLLINVLDISWGRLWPLALVALGVYLLLGRNSIGSTARTGYFNAPLDDTASADVRLNLSVGEASINALNNSDMLIDAELTYVGSVAFDVAGEAEKTVSLRQEGGSGLQWLNPNNWFNHEGYDWRIGLSPHVPMQLEVQGGLGKARLDLRQLQVTGLRLNGGVGEMEAALPASAEGYDVRVHGGMGEVSLDLPPQTDLLLDVQGGVGEIKVNTPVGAALRVEAQGGIGDVKLPPGVIQVANGGGFEMSKSGAWETPGYDKAETRIHLRYTGGVGDLKVR